MKKKTIMVIGILGILMVFGVAVALAQNSSEKTKDAKDHECTPEMMEDMSENCPEEMMQSGECENMMDGDMGSEMGSMMGSKGADKKGMM